ncbi:MAG: M20 family metallopeptidase [Rhodospirillales bacterium]|jgi:succinyl-diaminopimelate desuccinylase|nr:M20 family metallopeptidase [Rhodospirillales bacterium]MBT4627450.1 M20 family metallopeptidase [Rhodospirillales bacterium]MBT6825724.1 M20 family metallopeptidase [Rhodospirillales bacterium]MBT7777021.1 M20 family metallopeptidase [Rhodospirillales bacterium]
MNTTPDVIELTRHLVAMDTINPPGNEHQCCEYLAGLLDASGFVVQLLEFSTGRSNLVARLGGQDEDLPICLTGHVDTVPLGAEAWSCDPFGGEINENKIYGRGTTDMKGGVAAMVVAAIRLAQELPDTPGVVLVLTGGEETGCDGAKALCETPEILGRAGAVVVGEPTSNEALIGHKGALWLNAVSQGITAHGSTPELGVNAVYEACRAVAKIEDFGFNTPPHEIIGAPSINVGRIQGGINVNSVPDHAEFDIDIRTIPSQDHHEIRTHLEAYLGDKVTLAASVDVNGVISDASDPWIGEVFDVVEPILGSRPEISTAKYFTDASVLSPQYGNPPTIILGPGDASMAHKIDEYCEIDKLHQAVDIYEAIIKRWCRLD